MSAPRARGSVEQHVVEDQAEGVDVGALIDRFCPSLFRRHVRDGADDRAGHGLRRGERRALDSRCSGGRWIGPPVDRAMPKSMIIGSPALSTMMLAGFRVAMNHAGGMRGLETGRNPTRNLQNLRDRDCLFAPDDRRELLALDERHRDEFDAVDFADVMDADDIPVGDLSREQQLLLEAPLQIERWPPGRRRLPAE